MESFGILDFLKPLLSLSQNFPLSPPTSSPDQTHDVTRETTVKNQVAGGMEQEKTQENSAQNAVENNRSQAAFLSFLQSHEQRAKRFRR